MNLLNKVPDTFILSKLLQKDSTYIHKAIFQNFKNTHTTIFPTFFPPNNSFLQ